MAEKDVIGFHVMITGQVESARFHGIDNLYCKYVFVYGPDWQPVQGSQQGISQVSRKQGGGNNTVVWNFPIDASYKTTNAFGWPRLVLSVYSIDSLGRDVVRGYSSVLIPPFPGNYTRYVRTFAPVSSSLLQSFISWVTGNYPEFYDSKFVSHGEGREVTRTKSSGIVKCVFNVSTRGMGKFGYTVKDKGTSSVVKQV